MTLPVRVLVPLADGFEEIEAVTIIDVLRRADLEVIVAGLQPGPVTGSHGITLQTDRELDGVDVAHLHAVVLPGGMPGTTNLAADERILAIVRALYDGSRPVAAICAAPLVLAAAGIEEGLELTSHPSVRGQLGRAAVLDGPRVVHSGCVTTSQGPGTALEFALALVREFLGPAKAAELAGAMLAAETPREAPQERSGSGDSGTSPGRERTGRGSSR
jgi:4-methyl-5(b-hydroxyethyl)-thiazole monophosphate biosynthesis